MKGASEAACYVLFERGGKLLFVLRSNTGFMDGCYSLPAGRVEPAETYNAGAAREAAEEVCLTVPPRDLNHVCTVHRKTADGRFWTDVYFTASNWHGEPANGEPDRHSQIEWLPADDLPAEVMDYQRYALDRIAAGETYGEFGWT